MIISPGRGYVFVHIPKTGGTSLAMALEQRAMRDDILIGDTPKARRRRARLDGLSARGRLWKHSRLSDIEGILEPGQMRAMLVVTLVRNPWDRMVSYYHWLRAQRFRHPAVTRARRMPFGAFLRHPVTRVEMARDGVADYLTTSDGIEAPALVLCLDRLAEDLPRLERALGLRLEFPHENRSGRPPDTGAQYDDETRGIVAQHYAADIARFGFAFPT